MRFGLSAVRILKTELILETGEPSCAESILFHGASTRKNILVPCFVVKDRLSEAREVIQAIIRGLDFVPITID